MNKPTRIVSVTAFISAVVLLAGCTSPADAPPVTSATSGNAATPLDSGSTSAEVTELTADGASGALIDKLESQHGTQQIGPFKPPTPSIAVSVRCVGTHALHVDVQGVGSFDYQCPADPTAPIYTGVFGVTGIDSVTIVGSSENSTIWAMSINAAD